MNEINTSVYLEGSKAEIVQMNLITGVCDSFKVDVLLFENKKRAKDLVTKAKKGVLEIVESLKERGRYSEKYAELYNSKLDNCDKIMGQILNVKIRTN